MGEESPIPVGKLPPALLASLLRTLPCPDPRVVIRPAVGEDVAVIDIGDRYLVAKTDPITFAADRIGTYLAHVNANDIATAGARPRWCLVTALLPESHTTEALVRDIFRDLSEAVGMLGASLCGGHTEVTAGLERPILVATMLGEVDKERLVDKRHVRPGDAILMSKCVPVEGTAILAREWAGDLRHAFTQSEIRRAADYLNRPGLSVLAEAMAAVDAARIHGMHDVTEGGLATGLAELAAATGTGICVESDAIPIDPLGARICAHFGLDPLGLISSGTLLIVTAPPDADRVTEAVRAAGVDCCRIGHVTAQAGCCVILTSEGLEAPLPHFETDEITRLFGRST